jgi:SAM-dependent methyltransferase
MAATWRTDAHRSGEGKSKSFTRITPSRDSFQAMSDSLGFDTEADARQQARTYETPGAADRRRRVRAMLDLDPAAGERVLSVGCGPGFEPAELAEAAGESARVYGVDRSEAMLALARRRCGSHPQVRLAAGDATALPFADDAVDAAVAVQVYEYLDDVAPALAELARVVRPGGRAVVCDADFEALVWRSPNADRMARVLDAFDDHCPQPRLGSALGPHLRAAGFEVVRVEPNTILNTSLEPGRFAYHLMGSIEEYVAAHDEIGPDDATAWAEDLRRHDDRGETFFSYTQYCYLVRRPT